MTSRRIYIVDDDLAVRTSLEYLLSMIGNSRITSFDSGDAFLEAAATLEPGCLLLDLHMPGTTGIQVLSTVGGRPTRFVPIVLTGEGDVSVAVQAMKLGAVDFIEKPCDHLKLMGAVESAFSQQAASTVEERRKEKAISLLEQLSPRELDVLKGLIDGQSNKVIAHDLDISPRTVEIYRAKLMEKLQVRSLSEVLRIAFAAGLVPMD
ncbi:response regulator transcription factor [Novosphingobium aerophilum]|uniref:response regulator transcription factor n=1 Tax=Novosphingobium TaxID=165696 RepID=UPI0006C8A732|nr:MULTISPECIES: response regulator [unclassified Novosphingobium]KPH62802.1 response regulator FixJ [Novosphingobium sp. ST904]MPS71235.1 response regulator [Novosphingobium sp.]TCM39209.1 LuxR family two component transcriptional regulator [Novosphingobium sp. ST904]WRT92767.1 response regulator [Novosphingobium sp. RL4]